MAKILFCIVIFAFNFIFVQPNKDVSIKNILTKRNTADLKNVDGFLYKTDSNIINNQENSRYSDFNLFHNNSKGPISSSSISNIHNGNSNHLNNRFNLLKTVLEKSKKSLSGLEDEGNRCENPDDEYLENLLSEYQVFFRKYQETILRNNIEPNLMDNSNRQHTHMDPTSFIEQTQCTIQERKTNIINQASLCPWRYVTKLRHDRYPILKTEAKCTCDKCTTFANDKLPKHIYGCMPVLKPVPVLLRGECGQDGFFNWTPTTEEINVACVCVHKKSWVPLYKV
jgi:hypothetical protein